MASHNSGINNERATVNEIFGTMDYGTVTENFSSAEVWLKNLGTIGAYKNGVISLGKPYNIKGYNGKTLLDVVSPLPDDVDEIVAADVCNWENKKMTVLLYKLSNEIEKHSSLICQLEVLVRGILGKYAKIAVSLLVDYLKFYSSLSAVTNQENVTGISLSVVLDDIPLFAFGFILGSALASGCTVVLQTAPKISIIAMLIKQLTEKIGFPKNAVSILPGSINLSNLLKNEKLSIISCFGNLHEDVFKNASCLAKVPLISVPISKGPMIVFNNADLDSASNAVVDAAWGYSTVLPWSLSTVMVQEDIYPRFVDKLKSYFSKVRVGLPDDKLADISCIDECKLLNIEKVVKEVKLLGLEVIRNVSQTIILGGDILRNLGLENSNVSTVSVVAFRNTIEALNLANSYKYRMGISVWTENIGLANEVARKLQFTNIWINSFGKFSIFHSLGSYGSSGFGYPLHIKGEHELNKLVKCPSEQLVTKVNTTAISPCYSANGIFDKLTGKSAVAVAQKGHEAWKKKSLYERFQMLIKLSFEIEATKDFMSKKTGVPCHILDYWIDATYKAFAQYSNIGEVECNELFDIKTFRDPVGVIVIDESNYICSNIICIIDSLLLGNSVILLNFDQTFTNFYVEICRLLTMVKFTTGVLNIILNCENDMIENLLSFEGVHMFIYFLRCPKMRKIRSCQRICDGSKISSILLNATKVKTVWSNVENSVM